MSIWSDDEPDEKRLEKICRLLDFKRLIAQSNLPEKARLLEATDNLITNHINHVIS
jgi:hypothetical protein